MIDHRVEEAIHVIYEGASFLFLLTEQAVRAKESLPSNRAIAAMVRRHTGDSLGRIMREAGYHEGAIEDVPFYQRHLPSDEGTQVMALSDISKQQYVAYDGITFFEAKKVRDGFAAYPSRRKKRRQALVGLGIITAGVINISYGAGQPELLSKGLELSILTTALVWGRMDKMRTPSSPYNGLITGYPAVEYALNNIPTIEQQELTKEPYWDPSP